MHARVRGHLNVHDTSGSVITSSCLSIQPRKRRRRDRIGSRVRLCQVGSRWQGPGSPPSEFEVGPQPKVSCTMIWVEEQTFPLNGPAFSLSLRKPLSSNQNPRPRVVGSWYIAAWAYFLSSLFPCTLCVSILNRIKSRGAVCPICHILKQKQVCNVPQNRKLNLLRTRVLIKTTRLRLDPSRQA